MRVVYGDVSLGVKCSDRSYIFSYQTAGLESLVIRGKEWIFRAPKPTFWRATTDNDRGNGFSIKSAMWLGADMFIKPYGLVVSVDGTVLTKAELLAPANNKLLDSPLREANEVNIKYLYKTATSPEADVCVSYYVTEEGLRINFVYKGAEGLPELPVLGLRFILPFPASSFTYTGLSGETYPDRMKGGVEGTYQIDGMPVTQYVVPQDCGMHMNSSCVSIKRGDDELTFSMVDTKFAFSLLPYTAEELENALHHEELPPVRRSVLVMAAAVRGVGGINSWGADVEAPYHILGNKDYSLSFKIS